MTKNLLVCEAIGDELDMPGGFLEEFPDDERPVKRREAVHLTINVWEAIKRRANEMREAYRLGQVSEKDMWELEKRWDKLCEVAATKAFYIEPFGCAVKCRGCGSMDTRIMRAETESLRCREL